MTVTSFDPQDPSSLADTFSITPAARTHLERQLREQAAPWLRLGVTESGCNGFMYTMDFVAQPEDDDLVFEQDDGVNVVVRRSELGMIRGTEIDFVTEGLNSALKFKNPNASSHCGCGESFSLAESDLEG